MNHSEYSQNNSHKHKGHSMWWMILCCGSPILLYFILIWMGYEAAWMAYLLILACPIMHIFMMKDMFGKGPKKESACEKNVPLDSVKGDT